MADAVRHCWKEEEAPPGGLTHLETAPDTTPSHPGAGANHVTLAGVLLAAGAVAMIVTRHFTYGGVLLAFSGLLDVMDDGVAAPRKRSASPHSVFLGSIADRVIEGGLLLALVWRFAADGQSGAAVLYAAALWLFALVSYERARVGLLGAATPLGGLVERAERLVALAIGLMFPPLLSAALVCVIVLTAWTAVTLFLTVRRTLAPAPTGHDRRGAARERRADLPGAD